MFDASNVFQSVITPNQSWGVIHLGDSMMEVLQSLRRSGLESKATRDSMEFEVDTPNATLHFLEAHVPSLVLIVVKCPETTILEKRIVGRTLSESLAALNVSLKDEPIWSMVSINEEFRGGGKFEDQKRPIGRYPDLVLLDSGTLWIRRLGIGLCLNAGMVKSIALCKTENVPTIGSGILAQSTLDCASDPDLQQKLQASRPTTKENVSLRKCLWIVLLIAQVGVLDATYMCYQVHGSFFSMHPYLPIGLFLLFNIILCGLFPPWRRRR